MMNNINETIYLALAFTTGLALGTLFFGGLWLTVKKALTAKIPALWFVSSFVLRVSITVGGFYYMAAGSLQRLLLALCGFIIARFIITKAAKKHEDKQLIFKKENSNEY